MKTSRQPATVALVGGTGFIGRAVSSTLRARGHHVRLVARHSPAHLEKGEEFIAANTSQPTTLVTALTECDSVVHLVAILAERGETFDHVIHQGAQHVARAAQKADITHLVYVSALGANVSSRSAYARAKAHAESAVRKIYPHATILRPSLVMGAGGGFVRQVDLLTRHAPVMVLPGYGQTRFQPIFLDTLAEMIADACLNPAMQGQTMEAVGPQILTFRRLAEQQLAALHRKRLFIPLPWAVTMLIAHTLNSFDKLTFHRLLPEWLLVTPDQVRLLRADNVGSIPPS